MTTAAATTVLQVPAVTSRGKANFWVSRVAVNGALLISSLYFLLPLWWLLVASTKARGTQFQGSGMWFGTFGLFGNISDVLSFRDGIYPRMLLNSLVYAGGGALVGTTLSAMAGYALAKFDFPGRTGIFNTVLAAVLVPKILFTVPLFLLFTWVHLTDSYLAVLLPSFVSPFGVYLAAIFAAEAVPDEVIEAGRLDGASEGKIFRSIATRMMAPALVTIFLLQFVDIWNNYLLPSMVINDVSKQPVTVGLVSWNASNGQVPYNIIITGALISVIPLIVAFLSLQRFWRAGLSAGAVK